MALVTDSTGGCREGLGVAPTVSLSLAVLAMVGAIVMACTAFQAAESPRETDGLVAVQSEVDLGTVEQGSVAARFDLVNRSSKPVAVLRVVTGSACTEAKIVAKEVKPSEHIDLS